MLDEILLKTRRERPLVHCITNYVTANDCANILLACGASPIMAEDPDEAAEIVAQCSGLVLNMETPNPRKLQAMKFAGWEANRLGLPVILDPVGVGSFTLRRDAVRPSRGLCFRQSRPDRRGCTGSRLRHGLMRRDRTKPSISRGP